MEGVESASQNGHQVHRTTRSVEGADAVDVLTIGAGPDGDLVVENRKTCFPGVQKVIDLPSSILFTRGLSY